jgi:hypothetical protein
MDNILVFLKSAEVWIYALTGLVGVVYLRKFLASLGDYRKALFGLEKENARHRVSEAVSMLLLAAVIGGGEFLLVTFLVPSIPNIQILPTPTLDILTTPLTRFETPVGTQSAQTTAVPPSLAVNCPPGRLEFTDPLAGQEISGKVTLMGTVAVDDFGFYKYQFAKAESDSWVTIAAGNTLVRNAELGPWDTSTLMPGDYQLRIMVTDHQGAEQTPCTIPIRIKAP